jgi:hypothetical protein
MRVMTRMTGRCLCGKVTFVAEGVEPHSHACHCGMCRRWSGGAPFFGVSVSHVTFAGGEHLRRYASSDWAERGFCTTCGSSLFYFLKPTQLYTLGAGTFDDPSRFQLDREIFIDHKPQGYALAGDHPRLTEAEVFAEYEAPPKP